MLMLSAAFGFEEIVLHHITSIAMITRRLNPRRIAECDAGQQEVPSSALRLNAEFQLHQLIPSYTTRLGLVQPPDELGI
jgi:hypothetical protein